ncbi:FadR/GntR family transcriptional regulator [Jeotgalibacillus sp. R-1-5s-1]|uniref:FadR/GntR family transcriptional regulator n=1 Tax=Jeotgalibacillus sp. R-1-5s-1 TaxID=2555897 RepID=UPI00106AF007|nr:GntR family transcriptional regulator [Jeotgalibacillus sp. R-1-5s-1]TFD92500.1 FadR family transcriptional regulator [Jeotgalibacillus sp. R-1-5s-1]
MNQSKPQKKVFISVVHQLKSIIQQDRLTAGDRLPSERELSDRLNVGRSSVREALRALELLGLIETRHGEGTFLRDFRDHHLVDLLGMFILQSGRAEEDVAEVKRWIEEQSLYQLFQLSDEKKNHLFEQIFRKFDQGSIQHASQLKAELVNGAGNQLAFKIWLVLNDFYQLQYDSEKLTAEDLQHLQNYLMSGTPEEALSLLCSLVKKQTVR